MRGHSSPPSVCARCIRCRSNHQTNVNCLFVITLSTVCHIRMQFALSVGQLPVVTLTWGVETKGTHTKKQQRAWHPTAPPSGRVSHVGWCRFTLTPLTGVYASKPCGLMSVHIITSHGGESIVPECKHHASYPLPLLQHRLFFHSNNVVT